MLELRTERLMLTDWCEQDFEPLAEFLADGDANRHRGPGRALTREEAWDHLCELIGQWGLRDYGQFAIEEIATGDLVGYCGLWHPPDLDEPELSWNLFPAAQGRGYATEAAERVICWAAFELRLPPLFSFIHPDNTRALKLAERLGASLAGDTTFRGRHRLIYRHRDVNPETTVRTLTDEIRRKLHVSRETSSSPRRR